MTISITRAARTLCAAVAALLVAAPALAQNLTGAGATFPYPLYSKWFDEYGKVKPGARINYQSIGSGGGIRQITDRTVDFGASDAIMTEEQLSKAPGILHIPTVAGAVAVIYNLPGAKGKLNLDGETLAGIFLGSISTWNDPKLVKLNPGSPCRRSPSPWCTAATVRARPTSSPTT